MMSRDHHKGADIHRPLTDVRGSSSRYTRAAVGLVDDLVRPSAAMQVRFIAPGEKARAEGGRPGGQTSLAMRRWLGRL